MTRFSSDQHSPEQRILNKSTLDLDSGKITKKAE
jgi:hypothetical protein